MTELNLENLLALEHDGWKSLCESRGSAFYGELMTADGLMLVANGAALDRDTIVATMDQAPPWSTYEITEPRAIPLGSESAALVYRARAQRESDPPFTALMTSAYRLEEGRPRLALYQQTPTAE